MLNAVYVGNAVEKQSCFALHYCIFFTAGGTILGQMGRKQEYMLSLHLIKILEVWISGLSRDLKYKRTPDTAADLSSGQIYCRND